MVASRKRGENGGKRKVNQGSNWIRRTKRLAIYRRDDYRCAYCGKDLATEVATLDHVRPVELGGSNHESNLVTCCLSCNSSKSKLSLGKFLKVLADQGHSSEEISRRIRNSTSRKLVK